MEIIRQDLNIEYFDYPLLNEYLGGKSFAAFDIETMGLDPRRAPMILAGLMTVEPDGSAELKQYFLDRPEEEHLLLDALIEELNSYDYLITYNGKRFDLPYIVKRYHMINHEDPDIRPFDLDLYLAVRGFSGLKGVLPSLSQKSLEIYMGLGSDRTDLISGGESVELYYQYLTEADPFIKDSLKRQILLHNSDDVMQLYRLMPVLRQCDIHGAAYKLGFPVYQDEDDGGQVLKINEIRTAKTKLTVEGCYSGEPVSYHGFSNYEHPFETVFTKERTFKVTLPLLREGEGSYVNLLDYFDDTEDFKGCAGYVNDYLILSDGKDLNQRDINIFLKKLLKKI